MKKIFLHIFYILFLLLAQAGFCATEDVMTTNQLAKFIKTQWVYNPEGATDSARKPWQLLLVMNSPVDIKWGAVDDNRKAIEEQIKKGIIKRAAILYAREDGTVYLTFFPAKKQMAVKAFNPSDTPEYDYVKVDTSSMSESGLFTHLFRSFNNEDYYTALVLDMHGSGSDMQSYFIKGEHNIQPSLFINAMNKSGITVDLLDWNSCFMGTIGNVYNLFSNSKVKYATVSSNEGVAQQTGVSDGPNAGKQGVDNSVYGSFGAHPIIELLNGTPKQVATMLVKNKGAIIDNEFTHNLMAVDGDYFRLNVVPLIKNWAVSVKDSGVKLALKESYDGFPHVWFSEYLRKVAQSPKATENLTKYSYDLIKSTNKSIFSYGCWDKAAGVAYTTLSSVKNNGECIGGFSVDKVSLDKITFSKPMERNAPQINLNNKNFKKDLTNLKNTYKGNLSML